MSTLEAKAAKVTWPQPLACTQGTAPLTSCALACLSLRQGKKPALAHTRVCTRMALLQQAQQTVHLLFCAVFAKPTPQAERDIEALKAGLAGTTANLTDAVAKTAAGEAHHPALQLCLCGGGRGGGSMALVNLATSPLAGQFSPMPLFCGNTWQFTLQLLAGTRCPASAHVRPPARALCARQPTARPSSSQAPPAGHVLCQLAVCWPCSDRVLTACWPCADHARTADSAAIKTTNAAVAKNAANIKTAGDVIAKKQDAASLKADVDEARGFHRLVLLPHVLFRPPACRLVPRAAQCHRVEPAPPL